MSNLHVVPGLWHPSAGRGMLRFRVGGAGPIAFQYDSRTVRVADGVNEIEAREIVNELKAHHNIDRRPYVLHRGGG